MKNDMNRTWHQIREEKLGFLCVCETGMMNGTFHMLRTETQLEIFIYILELEFIFSVLLGIYAYGDNTLHIMWHVN